MTSHSPTLSFFLSLSRIDTALRRRMDAKLGWLGWSDFTILSALSGAGGKRMRRVDLAEAIGVTASGITRLLLPMEKIGLVRREAHDGDARVSYVAIAPGGENLLAEAVERAELYFADVIPASETSELAWADAYLKKLSNRMFDF